jgi:integrase
LIFPHPTTKQRLSENIFIDRARKSNLNCDTHGFRSSFRDWASERTDHPREVIEAALAHVVRNQTEAAYARSDLFERRRLLMDDWAAYVVGASLRLL